MALLYSSPSAILLLVAMAIAVAAAVGGQIYVHRRFSEQDFVQHNEVGGFIIAVVGTLYAVVLGFPDRPLRLYEPARTQEPFFCTRRFIDPNST